MCLTVLYVNSSADHCTTKRVNHANAKGFSRCSGRCRKWICARSHTDQRSTVFQLSFAGGLTRRATFQPIHKPTLLIRPIKSLLSNKRLGQITNSSFKQQRQTIKKAIQWLVAAQHADGGWGGGSHAHQEIRDPAAVPTDSCDNGVCCHSLDSCWAHAHFR